MATFELPARAALAPAIIATFSSAGVARANAITVDGTCTLADAIAAANTDASAGNCAAGSGKDTLEITADMQVGELPVLLTDMDIVGVAAAIPTISGVRRSSAGKGTELINSAQSPPSRFLRTLQKSAPARRELRAGG